MKPTKKLLVFSCIICYIFHRHVENDDIIISPPPPYIAGISRFFIFMYTTYSVPLQEKSEKVQTNA